MVNPSHGHRLISHGQCAVNVLILLLNIIRKLGSWAGTHCCSNKGLVETKITQSKFRHAGYIDILHWLPFPQRISYRIASLVWRCLRTALLCLQKMAEILSPVYYTGS